MKNVTKAAGAAGVIMGILGAGLAVAGSIAKGKDDKLANANEEFDNEFNSFCEKENETYTTPPAEEQEAEAPAEEG